MSKSIAVKQAKPQAIRSRPAEDRQTAVTRKLNQLTRSRKHSGLKRDTLILSANAYRKLVWFRDQKDTEVGAMGISKDNDPLWIEDFAFLPQECTAATTEFDEAKQTEWVLDRMEAGENPESFMRVWAHTHPSNSTMPSSTDWSTFEDVFAQTPWGVMLILGQSNEFSCVFRTGDQMKNLVVELASEEVPSGWSEELDNIETRKPKVWTGYGTGRTGYVTSRKAVKKTETKAIPNTLHGAIKELTGKDIYAQEFSWVPSAMDIYLIGPCRAVTLIQKALKLCQGNMPRARERVERIARSVSFLMANDGKFIENFDEEKYKNTSPLCNLVSARKTGLTIGQYRKKHPNTAGVKEWLCSGSGKDKIYVKGKYPKEIPDMLCSVDPSQNEAGFADVMASALNFYDFSEEIDKQCRTFAESFDQELSEYESGHTYGHSNHQSWIDYDVVS